MQHGVVTSEKIGRDTYIEVMDWGSTRIRVGEQVWSLLKVAPPVSHPANDILQSGGYERSVRPASCNIGETTQFNVLDRYANGAIKVVVFVRGTSPTGVFKHHVVIESAEIHAGRTFSRTDTVVPLNARSHNSRRMMFVRVPYDLHPVQGVAVTGIHSHGEIITNDVKGFRLYPIFMTGKLRSNVIIQCGIGGQITGTGPTDRIYACPRAEWRPVDSFAFWNEPPDNIVKGRIGMVGNIADQNPQPSFGRLDLHHTPDVSIGVGFGLTDNVCGITLYIRPQTTIEIVHAFICASDSSA